MTSAILSPQFGYSRFVKNMEASKVSSKLSGFVKSPAGFGEEQSQSRSVFLERSSELVQELRDTYRDCSTDNWDGYGALPLKIEAVREAERFLYAMPLWMPIPEICLLPNGDIGFQWSFGRNRILTVSLSGNDIVTYASILGSPERKKYGTEIFNDSIPKDVIEGIEEIQS